MTLLLIAVSALFTVLMTYRLGALLLTGSAHILHDATLDDDLRQVEELVARKTLVRDALQEIDLDLELEKISPEDHAQLKRRYEHQAIAIMRRLDAIHGGRGWEASIDAELSARLARPMPTEAALGVEDVLSVEAKPDIAPAPVAAEPAALALVACPSCEKLMEPQARFCSQCGTTMPALVAPPEAHHAPRTEVS